MSIKVIESELPGVLIIEPVVHYDSRGYFFEAFNEKHYKSVGIFEAFTQDNVAYSTRGVLRGLHFQNPSSQSKLVQVLYGEVFDVVVDVRLGSPTFGSWSGIVLSASNKKQLYIPQGFAHGYAVTSEGALFSYKCSNNYDPASEFSILWDDPSIGVRWPLNTPLVSEKDKKGRLFDSLTDADLPRYEL